MSGGISSNYNSGGNIYTTGWRGAGSAGSAGSADSMSSAGSAGSFGSTVTGSATGSFGDIDSVFNKLDSIYRDLVGPPEPEDPSKPQILPGGRLTPEQIEKLFPKNK